MENWQIEQKVFAVEAYIQSQSIVEVQRRFRRHFNVGRHGRVPASNTIRSWMNKFRTDGNLRNKWVGKRRSVRTEENIERVRIAFQRSPKRSAKRHSIALALSATSLHRILRHDLKLYPYKLQVVQQLKDGDKPARVAFSQTFTDILHQDPTVINRLIMSDEAHFYLSGHVNTQNARYWSNQNPREIHEKPLHSAKLTVWCGVSAVGIIGPYFFEEQNHTVTVTSARYCLLLEDFLPNELRRLGLNRDVVWFQQDGATCHTARQSMGILRNMFPGRLISRFGDINWPPRSPDLTVPDYFLWGYLKSRVYQNKPRTIPELKENITTEVRAINREMLQRVMGNLQTRLQECIEARGGHLKNVIFKN